MDVQRSSLIAVALALVAMQAPAAALSFSALAAAPGGYASPLYDTSDAALAYSYSGSSSRSLAPLGAGGSYLSLQRGGVATVELHGATSYSFLWGSPDAHNFIDIATSDGNVRFGGTDLAALRGFAANGDNSHASLFTIAAAAGVTIDSITFRSGGIAFELAVAETAVAAVPETGTSALMLVGLAALAGCARRRTSG